MTRLIPWFHIRAATTVLMGAGASAQIVFGNKDNDITAPESAESKGDLTMGSPKIDSKRVSTTDTPEHAVVSTSRGRSSGGNRGTSRTTAKKVSAEGTKFIGFAVVVQEGDRILGEYFDPAGLNAEVAK